MCLFRRCSKYERNSELVSNRCFSLIVVNVSSLLFYLDFSKSIAVNKDFSQHLFGAKDVRISETKHDRNNRIT